MTSGSAATSASTGIEKTAGSLVVTGIAAGEHDHVGDERIGRRTVVLRLRTQLIERPRRRSDRRGRGRDLVDPGSHVRRQSLGGLALSDGLADEVDVGQDLVDRLRVDDDDRETQLAHPRDVVGRA